MSISGRKNVVLAKCAVKKSVINCSVDESREDEQESKRKSSDKQEKSKDQSFTKKWSAGKEIRNTFTSRQTGEIGSISSTCDREEPLKLAYNKLKEHYDSLPINVLYQDLISKGICPNEDGRLAPVREALEKIYKGRNLNDIVINYERFKEVSEPVSALLVKIINNNLAIKDMSDWATFFSIYYDAIKEITGTELIVSLTSTDGQKMRWGAAKRYFPLNELIHPVFYLIVVELLGFCKIHETVGLEAKPKSEWAPGNPLIGAGALMVAACLVNGALENMSATERHESIKKLISDLAGESKILFDSKTFISSERKSEYLKAVLSWMIGEKKLNCSCKDTDKIVRFYLECSSLQIDADALSTLGASLANGGICANTGRKIISSETVSKVLSMMAVASSKPGVPILASSSGAILLIVPSLFSLSIYSEDMAASSYFISALSRHFALNNHERIFLNIRTPDDTSPMNPSALFATAKAGDVLTLSSLLFLNQPINITDYMGRTILHYAAICGHQSYIELALKICPQLVRTRDIMGQSASEVARFFNRYEIAELLQNWETVSQGINSLSSKSTLEETKRQSQNL